MADNITKVQIIKIIKEFQCEKCVSSFTCQKDLNAHVNEVHDTRIIIINGHREIGLVLAGR